MTAFPTTIPPRLADALTARGYTALTPVQQAVVEQEALARDLIVSAQTGSGKTVAFGLNMAGDILGEDGHVLDSREPLALVIAPTRELALQVSRELMWLFRDSGARIATCVGGMDASKERRNLAGGAQIVVGTPGRLRDHLERGALLLSNLKVAVLDEADEMLDMGFRDDLEEILDATPEGRRTLLFSATMPKPIVALAKRYQSDALRISTVGEDRGHGDIAYQAVTVAPSDIENAVVNLLRFHNAETAILFCATRDNVRRLHASLIERGFAAVALSGEHSQSERNQALQALRDRRAKVCVATDVAARGIDLPTLSLVIHVELPRDAETLQHRSGRTGRAGKKGTAVLLVPYQRRKRVESILRHAKINADWAPPPSAEDIRKADHQRLMEALLEPVDFDEEDRTLAIELLAKRPAEELAAMLVRAHRATMPQPEELIDTSKGPAKTPGPRPGFEDTLWYRLNVGRNQNADPRWILPLLCRRGHITRTDIGAIRIAANETLFEIPRAIADRFYKEAMKAQASADDAEDIYIEQVAGTPREAAKGNRRRANGPVADRPHAAKPFRSKEHRGKGDWGDRPQRSDRAERGERAERPERADRPAYGDRPARGPRTDKAGPAGGFARKTGKKDGAPFKGKKPGGFGPKKR